MTTNGVGRSVTAGDYVDNTRMGGVIHFLLASPSFTNAQPAALPDYWSWSRDFALRSTVYQEAMWAGSIGIAITKMASLGWDVKASVKGESLRLTTRIQELLHNADAGRGWVHFLSRHLRDFLTTDNGSFVEIERASTARGSRIVGIHHLDSLRCTRTGNLDRPVIYRDRENTYHELRDYQVISLSDMPDPGGLYFGVGLSAASRAYKSIQKLAAVETYLLEKITGSRATAIHFINGVNRDSLNDALVTADESMIRKGAVAYKGAVVVPMMGDVAPALVTIPLAEIPDGFNRKEEFDLAILSYANAIGIDVQDLQPLTGQALGTGAQSQVLDDKAEGKGLASWRQQFTHLFNTYIAPDAVTFYFSENDWRDKQAKANVESVIVKTTTDLVDSAVLAASQAMQYLVDQDILPREFLAVDQTAETDLSDDEKPIDQADIEPIAAPEAPENKVIEVPE